jgi:hypothetical protein
MRTPCMEQQQQQAEQTTMTSRGPGSDAMFLRRWQWRFDDEVNDSSSPQCHHSTSLFLLPFLLSSAVFGHGKRLSSHGEKQEVAVMATWAAPVDCWASHSEAPDRKIGLQKTSALLFLVCTACNIWCLTLLLIYDFWWARKKILDLMGEGLWVHFSFKVRWSCSVTKLCLTQSQRCFVHARYNNIRLDMWV